MKMTLLMASIGISAMAASSGSLADVRQGGSDVGPALVFIHGNDSNKSAAASRNRDVDAGRESRRDRERSRRARLGYERGMRVVSTVAGPGEPGDGWRYFTHPAASRAVVISPQGEYFFSGGQGLALVAVAQPRS